MSAEQGAEEEDKNQNFFDFIEGAASAAVGAVSSLVGGEEEEGASAAALGGAAAAGGGGSAPASSRLLVAQRQQVKLEPAAAAAGKSAGKSKGRGPKLSSPTNSATFYTARAKYPSLFTINDDGNLSAPAFGTSPAKVIYLPHYETARPEDLQSHVDRRMEELQQVQQEFDRVKKALREIMNIWIATKPPVPGSETQILDLQEKLMQLDSRRTMLLSPNRFTYLYEEPIEDKILMIESSQKKKVKYDVIALRRRPTTFEEEVVKTEKAWEPRMAKEEAAEMEELEAAGEGAGEEEMERLAFGAPGAEGIGLLSIDIRKPFTFEGTQYQFPIQAYEEKRLINLRGDALASVPKIMAQQTAAGVRTEAAKIVGQPRNAFDILVNILRVYVGQHPDIRAALLETGDTELVNTYSLRGDLFFASGLTEEQIETPRDEWLGKNMLGLAWMKIRKEIKETEAAAGGGGGGGLMKGGALEDFPSDTGFTRHAKTLQEANKERLPYILAAKRRATMGAPF